MQRDCGTWMNQVLCKRYFVRPGMILVGRITPRLDPPVTGEDKLVRAIFKSAAANVKDDSLYVPAGVTGTVVDVKVFRVKAMLEVSVQLLCKSFN